VGRFDPCRFGIGPFWLAGRFGFGPFWPVTKIIVWCQTVIKLLNECSQNRRLIWNFHLNLLELWPISQLTHSTNSKTMYQLLLNSLNNVFENPFIFILSVKIAYFRNVQYIFFSLSKTDHSFKNRPQFLNRYLKAMLGDYHYHPLTYPRHEPIKEIPI